jgi:hypothetical protein
MKFMSGALVPAGILEEIELVVILGVPPLRDGNDLRDNLLAFGCEILGLDLFGYTPSGGFLLWRVEKYC